MSHFENLSEKICLLENLEFAVQEEVGTRNLPREVSGKRKRGRSATKHKKAKRSNKNKHSKNKRRYRSTSSSSSTEKSSPSPEMCKSRRKKHKHCKRSSSSSCSSSPSSSSESSETKSRDGSLGTQFQFISEEDKFRYNIPTDMSEYANTHFETYVRETYLKQQISTENPVLDNLDQVKKLHDFARDILKDKGKQKDLDMDSTFEKIQSKNACVMGPLSKLWMLVEEANRSKKKQIPIDLDNIRAYTEQTVLLLGQTSNYITYFRRYNILAALNCPAQHSKEMLREEADLLQRHDRNLFGKKFSEHLVASAKSKKKKRQEKTKAFSEWPFRSTEEEFWKAVFEILPQQKIWEIEAKNIRRKLPPSSW